MKWVKFIFQWLAFLWPRKRESKKGDNDALWEARKRADEALKRKHRNRDVNPDYK